MESTVNCTTIVQFKYTVGGLEKVGLLHDVNKTLCPGETPEEQRRFMDIVSATYDSDAAHYAALAPVTVVNRNATAHKLITEGLPIGVAIAVMGDDRSEPYFRDHVGIEQEKFRKRERNGQLRMDERFGFEHICSAAERGITDAAEAAGRVFRGSLMVFAPNQPSVEYGWDTINKKARPPIYCHEPFKIIGFGNRSSQAIGVLHGMLGRPALEDDGMAEERMRLALRDINTMQPAIFQGENPDGKITSADGRGVILNEQRGPVGPIPNQILQLKHLLQ